MTRTLAGHVVHEAVWEEVEKLRGAARADEQRMIAAAAKAGIVYCGCDTPDALADEFERLRARLAEVERERDAALQAHADCEQGRIAAVRIMKARGEHLSRAEAVVEAALELWRQWGDDGLAECETPVAFDGWRAALAAYEKGKL